MSFWDDAVSPTPTSSVAPWFGSATEMTFAVGMLATTPNTSGSNVTGHTALVTASQRWLAKLGFSDVRVDGVIGPRTNGAMVALFGVGWRDVRWSDILQRLYTDYKAGRRYKITAPAPAASDAPHQVAQVQATFFDKMFEAENLPILLGGAALLFVLVNNRR